MTKLLYKFKKSNNVENFFNYFQNYFRITLELLENKQNLNDQFKEKMKFY